MSEVVDLQGLAPDILANALRVIYREDNVRSQDVNVYSSTRRVARGGSLVLANSKRSLPTARDSYYVFADLAPLSNWGHRARHLFFNPENGDLMHSESSAFPPKDFIRKPDAFKPLHVPKVHAAPATEQFFLPRPKTRVSRRNQAGNGYAMLFSGNSDNRHVNDAEFLFRTLCDVYNYDPDKIYVLNYDGTLNYNGDPHPVVNWPGDKTAYRMAGRIVGPGNQAGFDMAFAAVGKLIGSNDTLLIHTNNHGGDASTFGETWLCGYPNFELVYKASDFGDRIASLPTCKSLIVGMEQCYSGGFMTPTISNSKAAQTSFASAVPANMSSDGGLDFDPWAMDWIAAFNGLYPGGTPLKHPVISRPCTRAAFDYSNTIHSAGDSPVFLDAPHGVGASQQLR